jgi:hypothetical protein
MRQARSTDTKCQGQGDAIGNAETWLRLAKQTESGNKEKPE